MLLGQCLQFQGAAQDFWPETFVVVHYVRAVIMLSGSLVLHELKCERFPSASMSLPRYR